MSAALDKRKDKPSAPPLTDQDDGNVGGIYDPRIEESNEFRKRMGTWRTQTCTNLNDELLWLVDKIVADSLGPLDHHLVDLNLNTPIEDIGFVTA